MGVVESRNCRCNFDSKGRPLIQVAPLDAQRFSTYAYIQIKQSEAAGTRKRWLRRNSPVKWLFCNLPHGMIMLFDWGC